jgi:hypothetical protein
MDDDNIAVAVVIPIVESPYTPVPDAYTYPASG